MLRTTQRVVITTAMAVLVACCSAARPASLEPVATSAGGPSAGAPGVTPGTSHAPSARPFNSPAPTATPRPAAWSKPKPVDLYGCDQVGATIDEAGGMHLAAACRDSSIGYAT